MKSAKYEIFGIALIKNKLQHGGLSLCMVFRNTSSSGIPRQVCVQDELMLAALMRQDGNDLHATLKASAKVDEEEQLR